MFVIKNLIIKWYKNLSDEKNLFSLAEIHTQMHMWAAKVYPETTLKSTYGRTLSKKLFTYKLG